MRPSVWKTMTALVLILLLALSNPSAALAEAERAPAEPPVIRQASELPATPEGIEAEEHEYPAPKGSEHAREWTLHPEEEIRASVTQTVEEKVTALVAQCRAEGITGEYETALWLHDWLTHNANYDYTYSRFTPDGVLLYGTGVCQSYMSAYALLLDEAGIENRYITSDAMNHAWNLVRLDGEWCHIDVTWDDPNEGGYENHNYFGMNDALIGLDHTWEEQGAPAAASLKNYYPVRNGDVCYTNDEELDAQLSTKAEAGVGTIAIQYVGTERDRSAFTDFQSWYGKNGWKYGMNGWSASYGQYSCTVTVYYGEVETAPSGHLDTPVSAPDFTMNGPEGSFSLSSYRSNGLALIFGRTTCSNTRALLDSLQARLGGLHENGIEVLVSLCDAGVPSDLNGIKTAYPDYHYCYDSSSLMWSCLREASGSAGSVTFPCVFLLNEEGKIYYYSTGYVYDVPGLIGEMMLSANSNALPQPQPRSYTANQTGNASLSGLSDGAVKRALQAACAGGRKVFFLTDEEISAWSETALEEWEADCALFDSLGFSYVVCVQSLTEAMQAAYPHVTFVTYDENDGYFLELLDAVGYDYRSNGYYYLNSYYLEPDGRITDFQDGTPLSVWDKVNAYVLHMSYAVTAPAGLVSLEENAFESNSFVSADLSAAPLTAIGARAFAGNTALRVVRIPDTVTAIAPDAFEGCGNVLLVCSFNSAAAQFARNNGIAYLCP